MIIKGDVKILLKHVLILYPGEDQQYANFTTELRKNPEFTTVLSLEMYEKAFLFYFQEYTPTSVFFFIVTLQSKDCARARQPSSHGFGGLKIREEFAFAELRACSSSRLPLFELLSLASQYFGKSIDFRSRHFIPVESTPSPSKIRSFFGRSLWLAYTL